MQSLLFLVVPCLAAVQPATLELADCQLTSAVLPSGAIYLNSSCPLVTPVSERLESRLAALEAAAGEPAVADEIKLAGATITGNPGGIAISGFLEADRIDLPSLPPSVSLEGHAAAYNLSTPTGIGAELVLTNRYNDSVTSFWNGAWQVSNLRQVGVNHFFNFVVGGDSWGQCELGFVSGSSSGFGSATARFYWYGTSDGAHTQAGVESVTNSHETCMPGSDDACSTLSMSIRDKGSWSVIRADDKAATAADYQQDGNDSNNYLIIRVPVAIQGNTWSGWAQMKVAVKCLGLSAGTVPILVWTGSQ